MSIQNNPVGREAVDASAPSKWADVAEDVLEAVKAKMAEHARDAADKYYEGLLYCVQDYLSDNVRFNLASTLRSNNEELRRYRAERPRLVEGLRAAQSGLKSPHPEHVERAIERVASALDWADGRTTALSMDAMMAEVDASYSGGMGAGSRITLRRALNLLFADGPSMGQDDTDGRATG